MKSKTLVLLIIILIGLLMFSCTKKVTEAKNEHPDSPTDLYPANNADSVSINTTLSWSCTDSDGDSLTYDVYFGRNSSLDSSELVSVGQNDTLYNPGSLDYGITYYWKIVAKDDHNNSTVGDIWQFTTVHNNSPNLPNTPEPANNATSVSINAILSWSCTDSDSDSLTYDVYFGTDPILDGSELVSVGQNDTLYNPGSLDYGITYYWKIVAKDDHNNSTLGDIWQFTTIHNNPPNLPDTPEPANNADSVSIDTSLSWSCTDSDSDSLTYDVYFGRNSSLDSSELVSVGQNDTFYNPEILYYGITYYWKIVAKDEHNNSTVGNIWQFTTDENIDPADYSFYMVMAKSDYEKGNYMIYFDSKNDTINSVELTIDNEPVEVTHESYGGDYDWFVSDLSFNENQTYTFEVKINESKSVSNFSLKIPDLITGDWPDSLDLTQPTTISWTQTHDTMYQEFEGDAYKAETDEEVYKYEILSPSARSYTMPANWLPADYDEYDLSIVAGNYHTDSHLLAVAMSWDYMDYGYTNKTSNIERMKNLMKRFAKSIK